MRRVAEGMILSSGGSGLGCDFHVHFILVERYTLCGIDLVRFI